MRRAIVGFLLVGVAGTALSTTDRAVAEAKVDDSTKEIKLPTIEPNLPPGKGLEAVNAACVMCHSTRYITMQPNLSRKTWGTLVDKMRKTFGAPMSEEQAAQVVDYCVTVRGTPEDKAQPGK